MPPSVKRPRRARRETSGVPNDAIDSSPIRPSKRRKKYDDSAEKPERAALPTDRSGIPMRDDELVTAVVPVLAMPPHFVQASQDHANSVHERHSKDGVQAYAKLAGKDWTFYIKKLRNNIGRPPEGAINAVPKTSGQTKDPRDGLPDEGHEEDMESQVHIDLGPNKMVSRLHAQIYFDSDGAEWNITVKGRNGIRLDDVSLRSGDKRVLRSGQVIDIGGVEMMFVLPQADGSLTVHKNYLQRAGLIALDAHDIDEEECQTPPNGTSGQSALPANVKHGSQTPLSIAPAPPDYRRPGSPSLAQLGPMYSTGKSPGYANGGTVLTNAEDIDLSLDENQHIKPSYSYAQMISQAILDTEDEKLNLNGIYNYIMDKYAYYRHQLGGGWQNSIRHNLSLNKAFHKVARTTDEPGKGMKWCIVPEVRDEMAKNCIRGGRGGHRGSSTPASPGVHGHAIRTSKELAATSSSVRKPKPSPRPFSPPLSSYASNAPQLTPERGSRLPGTLLELPGDGSPLPRHRRNKNSTYGFSDNVLGSPPVISSSYLQDEGSSFITPAPHRVHPRLVPPSTAQRPSQHMPTSSPAPFWKYADIGSTPLKGPAFDLSPLKGSSFGTDIPQSSSPAPARTSPIRSPSGNSSANKHELPKSEEIEEEEPGFDLTRGFQSIGSYHAPNGNSIAVGNSHSGRS